MKEREHHNPTAEEVREFLESLSPARREQFKARLYTEEETRRTAWLCPVHKCDGTPHLNYPVPHARANQRVFHDPDTIGTLVMAGRGYGKTRTGAEWVRDLVVNERANNISLIARTNLDVENVMLYGSSGLMNVFPSWQRPVYVRSKHEIHFHNGVIARTFSSEKPDAIRGHEHGAVWGDEVSTWRDLYACIYNILFGLRYNGKGQEIPPQCLFTGTPRPTHEMRELIKGTYGALKIVRGTTYENLDNLPDLYRTAIVEQFEGTRTGRQELLGEMLEDVPGALLRIETFEHKDFRPEKPQTDITKIIVAVDPAVTNETKSDFTGICVVGTDAAKQRGYVLHSERMKESPEACMRRAIDLYRAYMASGIVAEVNNGGNYVSTVVKQIDNTVPVHTVRASVGKMARAEPIAMLYQQGRISHLPQFDNHAQLELEWTTWVPPGTKDPEGNVIPSTQSPDVMDAVVWGLTHLMLKGAVTNTWTPHLSNT